MTSETGDSLEVEQAAEHVAVGARDAALLVQQIDGAFQFLVAGQHDGMSARIERRPS